MLDTRKNALTSRAKDHEKSDSRSGGDHDILVDLRIWAKMEYSRDAESSTIFSARALPLFVDLLSMQEPEDSAIRFGADLDEISVGYERETEFAIAYELSNISLYRGSPMPVPLARINFDTLRFVRAAGFEGTAGRLLKLYGRIDNIEYRVYGDGELILSNSTGKLELEISNEKMLGNPLTVLASHRFSQNPEFLKNRIKRRRARHF